MSLLLHVKGSALALHYVAPSLEVPISGFIFTAERVFVVLVEPLDAELQRCEVEPGPLRHQSPSLVLGQSLTLELLPNLRQSPSLR